MREILSNIQIDGFKSFRETKVELRPLNILIGANSVGKSNFVSLFSLLVAASEKRLQEYIAAAGGPDAICHYGQKVTPHPTIRFGIDDMERPIWVNGDFKADKYSYSLDLSMVGPAQTKIIFPAGLTPEEEAKLKEEMPIKIFPLEGLGHSTEKSLSMGTLSHKHPPDPEPVLSDVARADAKIGAREVCRLLTGLRVYQFHDTSTFAKIRGEAYIHDNGGLRPDGANLAAFLYYLRERHESHYRAIVGAIRQVFPNFDDFDVSPLRLNDQQVMLNWREKGHDLLFGPRQLSDGLLRFIALAALLLQPPDELPPLVVIDEPELGLHPYAIGVLASLLRKASHHCQVIVATQSVTLVDQFEPGDIVIVERDEGASVLRRLDEDKLKDWLEEYSLGELWEKNVLGGRPKR